MEQEWIMVFEKKKSEDEDWGRLLAMELCMKIWFGIKWCRFGVPPPGTPRFAKFLCKGPVSKYHRLCGIVSLLQLLNILF